MRKATHNIIMIREGAAVERCHTLPHHGSYSNGAHQYGCAMLYLELHPAPSLYTLRAILTHDLGERWVGDNPAPAKWSMPKELRAALAGLEDQCLEAMSLKYDLTENEAKWLKAVDCLDLWLWGHEQVAMGNRNAQVVIDNLDKYFALKPEMLPRPVEAFLLNYKWTRTPDEIPE
jgi:5'-deoxynucleotidase YfbR-like HD superfamily hydrolase